MKRKLCALIAIMAIFCFATDGFSQTRAGGGLAVGTGPGGFGFFIDGEAFVTENIAFAPGFTVLFTSRFTTFWSIDFNGHYYLFEDNIGLYGLGGLQIARLTNFIGRTRLGINAGVGYTYPISSSPLVVFGEFKGTIGVSDQAVFSAGVRWNL